MPDPLMVSDVGGDICKWLTLAGLEAQACRDGPFREEQEVLPCTRKPSSGSHSHPQNATSKAPAFYQVESDTGFPESSICFWGEVWMNQADENASVVNISGGCQSKPCIPGRMACGLDNEAQQKAGAQRKMCYF